MMHQTSQILEVPALIWTVNEDMKFISVSGTDFEKLVVSIEKVVGKSIQEVENQLPILKAEEYTQVITQGSIKNVFCAHGEDEYWVSLHLTQKKPIRIAGTAHKINLSNKYKNRLEDLLKRLPVPLIISSVEEGEILFANENAGEIFGIHQDELLSIKENELFIDKHEKEMVIHALKKGDNVHYYETQILHPLKKKNVWLNVATRLTFFEERLCILFLFFDITYQKENEQKWSSLIRYAPDYVMQTDLQGFIHYTNKAFLNIPSEEIIGKSIYEIVPKQDQESIKNKVDYILKTGLSEQYEFEMSPSAMAEDTLWFSLRMSPIYIDKQISGFAVVATNITEAKNKENELRLSESKNKALIKTIPDLMLVVSEQGDILDSNNPQTKFFFASSSLIGQRITAIFSPDVSKNIQSCIYRTLSTKEPLQLKFNLRTPLGIEYYEARFAICAEMEVLVIIRNISDQIKAELEANERKTEYRQLLNNIDEIVYSFRMNKISFISDQVTKILGYAPEDFRNELSNWLRIIHPEDKKNVENAIAESIKHHNRIKLIYRIKHKKDNQYIWIEDRIITRFNNEGQFVGVFGVARDITKNMVADEEKQKFTLLIEHSKDLIITTTHDGRITYVNEAGCKLLGFDSLYTLMFRDVFSFLSEKENDIRQQVLNEIGNHKAWAGELGITNAKTQQRLDIEATFFGIYQGNVLSNIAVSMRDITDRKASQKVISESEEKYRSLIETMNEGILSVDKELKISFVNRRACQILEYTEAELCALNLYDLLYDQSQKDQFIHHLSTKEEHLEIEEVVLCSKNIDKVQVWLSYTPIKQDSDEIVGYHVIMTDITRLKQTESHLTAVKKELEQLLYRASHDLKAPISSSKGLINLMKLEINDAKMNYYADLMNDSLQKLSNCVEDLIKVSFIKQGVLEYDRVEVSYILEEIISSFKFYPNSEKIKFQINTSLSKPFISDVNIFKGIARNLIENSIKYSKKGIIDAYVKIDIWEEDEGIFFKIEDNGIGIPKVALGQIFDLFFRATEKSKGSGLGLYIVQEGVHRLGGQIKVDSIEHEKTVFTIFLPSHEDKFPLH